VGFISLGCPKNLVDSEVMMGLLDRAGARLTNNPEDAEILVVNTCSFIDSAKQESVNTILEMVQHKTNASSSPAASSNATATKSRKTSPK
jgi:ribosomal protein S12 methylthiotransferase